MELEKTSHSEQYMDYSGGKENAPTLTVMVGPAGSGKSTHARSLVNWAAGATVRVNRDTIRAMLYCDSPWNHSKEDVVRKYEEEGIRMFLAMGLNVIVDDTNCVSRTRQKLEEIARGARVKFCLHVMNVDKEECKRRNALRTGKECVPEEAIDQQFKRLRETTVRPAGYGLDETNRAVDDWNELIAAGMGRSEFRERLPGAPWVFCDVDGTLAENLGERNQFDESKVLLDACREPVAAWVRALYPTHNIAIVSGRHDTCCNDTCDWLEMYKVPFDLILMRPATSYVSDHIVKQNILDALLKVIDKGRIAFSIDDRPKVVNQVWRNAKIKVYPVGGMVAAPGEQATAHTASCTFDLANVKKGFRRCPSCGALEDF
jgi:predicted kinase